jgi:hypothetical protein
MSDARERSLNENGRHKEDETVSRAIWVTLAAIPRLKCGALAMIGQAFGILVSQHTTNCGKIALPITRASG